MSDIQFSEDTLRSHMYEGTRLAIGSRKYRVGRMNYGDYFLEPGVPQGEMTDFNPGTIWLKVVKRERDPLFGHEAVFYGVDYVQEK